jgi:hypothetical protein
MSLEILCAAGVRLLSCVTCQMTALKAKPGSRYASGVVLFPPGFHLHSHQLNLSGRVPVCVHFGYTSVLFKCGIFFYL